jgi:hypothetical protein
LENTAHRQANSGAENVARTVENSDAENTAHMLENSDAENTAHMVENSDAEKYSSHSGEYTERKTDRGRELTWWGLRMGKIRPTEWKIWIGIQLKGSSVGVGKYSK